MWLQEKLNKTKDINTFYYSTCRGMKSLIRISKINEELAYLSLPRKMLEKEKLTIMSIAHEYRRRECLIKTPIGRI